MEKRNRCHNDYFISDFSVSLTKGAFPVVGVGISGETRLYRFYFS
jgi:hypothetical protein